MKDNNQIVIVNVDKSVYVAILLKNDYHDKLSKVFDNKENFEKIQRR